MGSQQNEKTLNSILLEFNIAITRANQVSSLERRDGLKTINQTSAPSTSLIFDSFTGSMTPFSVMIA